jgi:hypothetical protein
MKCWNDRKKVKPAKGRKNVHRTFRNNKMRDMTEGNWLEELTLLGQMLLSYVYSHSMNRRSGWGLGPAQDRTILQ